MTDLTDLYTVEAHGIGAEMQVKGPDGVKLDMYISFVGIDSEKWEEIQTKFRTEQLEAATKGKTALAKVISKMLSEAAFAWRGFKSKGDVVEFTNDAAFELFVNAPYVREQADDYIATRANFIKG